MAAIWQSEKRQVWTAWSAVQALHAALVIRCPHHRQSLKQAVPARAPGTLRRPCTPSQSCRPPSAAAAPVGGLIWSCPGWRARAVHWPGTAVGLVGWLGIMSKGHGGAARASKLRAAAVQLQRAQRMREPPAAPAHAAFPLPLPLPLPLACCEGKEDSRFIVMVSRALV